MIDLLQTVITGDSMALARLNEVQEIVSSIQKKISINPYMTIGATIVGGLIVWLGQYFDRKAKRKDSINQTKLELIGTAELILINIKTALKSLATEKSLRSYYWYCYIDEAKAGNKRDIEMEKKYFADHHISSINGIACVVKIGELLGSYYSCVSRFKILTKAGFDTDLILALVTQTEYENAPDIDQGLDNEAALDEQEKIQDRLAVVYRTQFNALDQLNETIKKV